MIGLETRPDFINRIANSDGVREYIRPDGRQMDWTPLAERSPAVTRTVILSNGEDAVAAFEWTAPGIYQSHTLFAPTCRGRRAIDTAIEMIRWMFDHGGPPADKVESFESNRNLFYVACSRPRRRLALLFTQVLSPAAMAKVTDLFGAANVVALPADPAVPAQM